MTIDEFKAYRFHSGMKAIYKGCVYQISSVNFEEFLFGLSDENFDDNDDLIWVRCENAEVITQ